MRLIVFTATLMMLLVNVDVQAVKIAAFGDSITRGYPYYPNDANGIANNGGYIPSLQSQLNANDWGSGSAVTVYNWGHPGEYVTGTGRDRFRAPSDILNSNPDYVLVMEGTNDLALGWSPGGIYYKQKDIITDIQAAGRVPVIGTLLPRYDGDVSNSTIDVANDNIYTIAQDHSIDVADLNAGVANWASYLPDGLHPNTTGYGLMANIWYDTFATAKAEKEAEEARKEAEARARLAGALVGSNYLLLLSD